MPYLIAQGKQPHQRWRRLVPEATKVSLGRTTPRWNVPWDTQISRVHAYLQLKGDILQVHSDESASNAIYFQGHESKAFKSTFCDRRN